MAELAFVFGFLAGLAGACLCALITLWWIERD